MGSIEKILVPEWYKSQKGSKSSNAISDHSGNGSSSRRPVNDIESNKFEERGISLRVGRPTSARSETYTSFGGRGGKFFDDSHPNYSGSKVEGRSDVDSWRNNKEMVGKNNILSGKNVNNSSASRRSSFKQNFPALNNVQKNEVTATASSDATKLNKVGVENKISNLAEAPKPISESNSTGKNMVEALTQAPKIQAPSKMPADTSRADELEAKRYMQLIPVISPAHKLTALNNSEKPKPRQPVLPNKTEIPKKLQIGHLQVLTRGENGVVIPIDSGSKDGGSGIAIISQDIPKNTPSKPDKKVESACRKTVSVAQKKRKDFFDSIRKINTNSNSAHKSLSLDVNNETCDDKVEGNKEVNIVQKKIENSEINVDESNKQEVAELDEKDKAFMQSLGWVEEEAVEPLTQEEIDAFINKCKKLNADHELWVSYNSAESSSVQTS